MMKYIIVLFVFMASLSSYSQSSYLINDYPGAGNPDGINQEQDDALSGWSILLDASSNTSSANIWSSCAPLSFPVSIFEEDVTHFHVNYNGLVNLFSSNPSVCWTTATPMIVNSQTFPNSNISNLLAVFHHNFAANGSIINGKVAYKTFGHAPNRQFWIKWVDIEYRSSHLSNFKATYAVAIEENSGDINFVDMTKNINTVMEQPILGIQNDDENISIGTYENFRSESNNYEDNSFVNFKLGDSPMSGDYTIGGNQADFNTVYDAFLNLRKLSNQGNIGFNFLPGEYRMAITVSLDILSNNLDTIFFSSTTGNFEDVTLYFDSIPKYYLIPSITSLFSRSIFSLTNGNVKFEELTFDLELNSNRIISAINIYDANSLEFKKCSFIKNLEYIFIDIPNTEATCFIKMYALNNFLADQCKFENGDVGIQSVFGGNIDFGNSNFIISNSLFLNNKLGVYSDYNYSLSVIKNNYFIGENATGFHAITGLNFKSRYQLTIENNKFRFLNYEHAIQVWNSYDAYIAIKNNFISHEINVPIEASTVRIMNFFSPTTTNMGSTIEFHHNSMNAFGNRFESNASLKIDSTYFINSSISLVNNIFKNTNYNGKIYEFGCIESSNQIISESNNFDFYNVFGTICDTDFNTLNGWRTHTEPRIGSQEINSFVDAPKFKSPNNLHLKSNSPCIDTGAYVSVDEDIDGDTRDPMAIDIGADEYVFISSRWIRQAETFSSSQKMELYPNPIQSGEILQISFTEVIKVNSILIYNSNGIKVYEEEIGLDETLAASITIPELASGIYQLQVNEQEREMQFNSSFIIIK